jgi:hypothetical protein
MAYYPPGYPGLHLQVLIASMLSSIHSDCSVFRKIMVPSVLCVVHSALQMRELKLRHIKEFTYIHIAYK